EQEPNGIDPADPNDTNQIMPRPCKFISKNLPLCSVIRPTSTAKAGAFAAATGLTNSGLFQGQSKAFFNFLFELALEADAPQRGFGPTGWRPVYRAGLKRAGLTVRVSGATARARFIFFRGDFVRNCFLAVRPVILAAAENPRTKSQMSEPDAIIDIGANLA